MKSKLGLIIVFTALFIPLSAHAKSLEQCLLDELPSIKDASQARPTYQYCKNNHELYTGEKQSSSWFGYEDSWQCIVDNKRKTIGKSAHRYVVRACTTLYRAKSS